MAKSKNAEVSQALYCEECEDFTSLVRIYECNNCGTADDERRCDQCNKFKGRREDDGCENCFSEKVSLVDTVIDHDGVMIRLEDYAPDGEAYSARQKAYQAEVEAKIKAREDEESSKLRAGAERKTWADVRPGNQVLRPGTRGSEIDTLRNGNVLNIVVVGENHPEELEAGTVLATVEHYGVSTEPHDPSEEVWVVREPEEPFTVADASERYRVSVVEDEVHSTPTNLLVMRFGFSHSRIGVVPVGSIMGRSSEYSNMYTNVCAFTDPREARAYADAVELAAQKLKSMEGSVTGERRHYEFDNERFMDPQPDTGFHIKVGPTGWGDFKCSAEFSNREDRRGRMTYSVGDTAVLEDIAECSRKIADRLEAALGW